MQQVLSQARTRNIYDTIHAGARYLDYLLEKPLELIIPGYTRRRDEMLKRGLYKMLEGESLNPVECLRVGFQAPFGKSAWALAFLAGVLMTHMSYTTNDRTPFVIAESVLTGLSVLHNVVIEGKLEKIVASFSEGDRAMLRGYLGSNRIDYARNMLYEKGW